MGVAAAAAPVPAGAQVMLGAYAKGGSQAFTDLETQMGRKLAIDFHYVGLGQTQLNAEAADIANGQMPLIAMTVTARKAKTCFTASDIAGGLYDVQLTAQAAAVAALGATVMISFVSEMTDQKSSSDCFYGAGWDQNATTITNAGAAYVAAQQHVVQMFRNAGATNAQFAFVPEGSAYSTFVNNVAEWKLFYPGSATVDALGMDHHYAGRAQEDFAADETVLALYNACVDLGKPCVLAETGASPSTDYIVTAQNTIPVLFPKMTAFVWDDGDFKLQGTGLSAFTTMGQDSHFQQMP